MYINYILYSIYIDILYIIIYHFNGFNTELEPLNSP